MERANVRTGSEYKRVRVSSKRQITIPRKFYTALGFGDEAECFLRGDEIVIRPVVKPAGGEFAEQILSDLIARGLSGHELLEAFKTEQKKVRPAVEAMIADAEKAADGTGEYETYDDIFGTEE